MELLSLISSYDNSKTEIIFNYRDDNSITEMMSLFFSIVFYTTPPELRNVEKLLFVQVAEMSGPVKRYTC